MNMYSWIGPQRPEGVKLVLGLSLSDFQSETSFGNLRASSTQVLCQNVKKRTCTLEVISPLGFNGDLSS